MTEVDQNLQEYFAVFNIQASSLWLACLCLCIYSIYSISVPGCVSWLGPGLLPPARCLILLSPRCGATRGTGPHS